MAAHLIFPLVLLLLWCPSQGISHDNRAARVLNFFPIPVSEECFSGDKRRTGVCLNAYECRIQNGEAHGPCALGFGVCCVFTASCGVEVANNVTYFLSPNFPDFLPRSASPSACTVIVKKVDPSISQLRLDFVHFNLGQPNRRTGVCDRDIFHLTGGSRTRNLRICGQNSGQHVYYDLDNTDEPIRITMNLTGENRLRLWEIKDELSKFLLEPSETTTEAPWDPVIKSSSQSTANDENDCPRNMSYYCIRIIQTMNFADNGRHLADQDYTICMRQEEGMCSIAYEPCDENSFKIGPPVASDPGGSGDGPSSSSIKECNDKIVMPCDSEEFIMPGGSPGVCDLLHCGSSFCAQGESPCRIESSTTPFNIRVQFGPGTLEESPEDNLGMCLQYEQLPCGV